MKLYYSKGSCSLSVRIIIHELNAPSLFEAVDLKTKKTETGLDYLTINPKGAVPALVLDNGEILTENVAIQIYLADEYNSNQLLPKMGDFKRYHVIEWLAFAASDIHKSFSALFNPKVPADEKENLFIPILKSKLDVVEKQLTKHAYLAGEHFTLPDSYVFVMLRWLKNFNITLEAWPHIARYFNKISARLSVEKSLAEGG